MNDTNKPADDTAILVANGMSPEETARVIAAWKRARARGETLNLVIEVGDTATKAFEPGAPL